MATTRRSTRKTRTRKTASDSDPIRRDPIVSVNTVERLGTALAESTAHLLVSNAQVWAELIQDTNAAVWGFGRSDVTGTADRSPYYVDEDGNTHRRRSFVGSIAHAVNESARAVSDSLEHFSDVNRDAEHGTGHVEADVEEEEIVTERTTTTT